MVYLGTANTYHIMCFDFLPERVDHTKQGELFIDEYNSVELTYCSKQDKNEKITFRGRFKPSKQSMFLSYTTLRKFKTEAFGALKNLWGSKCS